LTQENIYTHTHTHTYTHGTSVQGLSVTGIRQDRMSVLPKAILNQECLRFTQPVSANYQHISHSKSAQEVMLDMQPGDGRFESWYGHRLVVTEFLHGLPRSLYTNVRTVPVIRQQPLPSRLWTSSLHQSSPR